MAPGTAQEALRAGSLDPKRAAGLWLTDGHRVLLIRRATWVTHPGTWTVPGGYVRAGETLLEGARREFREEAGFLPPHRVGASQNVLGFQVFCVFSHSSNVGWVPLRNGESTDFVWADYAWMQANWNDLHPGLQALLGPSKVAARDTIDKDWVKKVRKTWKGFVGKAKSVGYMEAEKYLDNGVEWLDALANDIAFNKGFFTFLRKDKKQHTDIYKMKLKAMEDLKGAWKYLNGGRIAVEFWEKTLTPGTREWKLGAEHRHSAMKDLARETGQPDAVSSIEDADRFAKENPHLVEKFLSKTLKAQTVEAVTKADALFSRKFLAHLTRIMNKWQSEIEWGTFEREFSIGNVKVVMVDIPHPFVQEQYGKHLPSEVGGYIRQLQKAEALLKKKGLGFLWYGTIFVSCKECGGENSHGKRWGVGAHYDVQKDVVRIFMDASSNLYRLVAHELGHRYYYKFMSMADRARFDSYFGDVPAVSEYGGTVSEEDFAEVFSYYIDNRNLTRDQLERFKRFIKTKGKMASHRPLRFLRWSGSFKVVNKTRMRLSADDLATLWSNRNRRAWPT